MASIDSIIDSEVEKNMEVEGECVGAEEMTAQVVALQTQLDELRCRAIKARAEHESLDPSQYKSEEFYTKAMSPEKLNNVTQGRTRAFLNYCTLQDALRGSESVKALKAGLDLLDDKEKGEASASGETEGEDIILEPEEKTYVLELMDEEKELSAELTEKSKICTQQEIQILQMRQEVAENLCKISDLWSGITDHGVKAHVKDTDLQERLKHEEAKLNQMRLMIQRLMIGERNLAQIFDQQTNEKFKEVFETCGLKPDELREDKMDLTPAVS